MVPLYRVIVKRDVSTKTPVTVPYYEIRILKFIHGQENVQDESGHVLEKLDKPVGKFPNSGDEYQRLIIKYGDAVAKCYPSKDELLSLVKKQELKNGATSSL
ncbi:hypothetical protein NB636_02060 [Oxalobacter aliiformigenes]|uniref:hypothetical protein n=1 Tax=Oxalobacter aliiformigenes TaxID=2946593 RepID=UPI0022AECD47|nr:hypothetical protein [Oxalobacter aliiformigenes]MCZ4065453.1 hypothetical protein [Oxalobacter aliiformigenes]WAV99672.1 hypothetical protein NB636_02060 [Oxalobacter aliiformigenes]